MALAIFLQKVLQMFLAFPVGFRRGDADKVGADGFGEIFNFGGGGVHFALMGLGALVRNKFAIL